MTLRTASVLWGTVIISACGCALPGGEGSGVPERTPVRWQLVEKRYGGLDGEGAGPSSHAHPDAIALVFEPLYEEDLMPEIISAGSGLEVEVVSVTPPCAARPGEVVQAHVRVARAEPRGRYRLTATPTSNAVTIVGDAAATVRGGEGAVFRFTSSAPGRLGVRIDAAWEE